MTSFLFASVPFEQFQVINTADVDEAYPQICGALNSARFQVLRGKITQNQLELIPCGNLSLLRLRFGYGAEFSVDPDCLDGYYLLVMPTQGHAEFFFDGHSIQISSQEAALISPDKRFYFRTSHDYEQVLLRLNRSAISDAWQRLTAQEQAPNIYFDAVMPLNAAGWQALLPMLHWVMRCSNLNPEKSIRQAAILAQTELLLATTLLLHQPHSMAAQLWPAPPISTPQAIRRAKKYMLENLSERLPVTIIASHCGLSVRHLQALFKDECQQSPLQWLRLQRLQAVHRALSYSADETAKISEIAKRFGFKHMGDFSQIYRQTFGETPRQTQSKIKTKMIGSNP